MTDRWPQLHEELLFYICDDHVGFLVPVTKLMSTFLTPCKSATLTVNAQVICSSQ